MSRVTIHIDGKEVQAKSGDTVLEAALAAGFYIPHLCYCADLKPEALCRLCIVEMADGELMTACRVPVIQGMVIKTRSPAIDRAIRPTVEMLIMYHHERCAGCPASGKCELQTVMSHLKIDRKRVRRLRQPPAKRPINVMNRCFDYDPNRCILCGVCIRTCEAIHGESLLYYIGRGHEAKVAFYGDETKCETCLKCVERCPVGTLLLKKPTETK